MNEKHEYFILPKRRNYAEQEAAHLELESKNKKQESDQWIKDQEIDFSKAVNLIDKVLDGLEFGNFPYEFTIKGIISSPVRRSLQIAYKDAANLSLQFAELEGAYNNGILELLTIIRFKLIK